MRSWKYSWIGLTGGSSWANCRDHRRLPNPPVVSIGVEWEVAVQRSFEGGKPGAPGSSVVVIIPLLSAKRGHSGEGVARLGRTRSLTRRSGCTSLSVPLSIHGPVAFMRVLAESQLCVRETIGRWGSALTLLLASYAGSYVALIRASRS